MFTLKPDVRHIFFDLDDTLFSHSRAKAVAASEFLELHLAELHDDTLEMAIARWERLAEETWSLYETGAIDFQGQRRLRIRGMFTREIADGEADMLFEETLAAYSRRWIAYSGALAFLGQTKSLGQHVITNAPADFQRSKLVAMGIADHFQTLTTPDTSGAWKPDPAIFRAALDAAGADPEQSLMIGDDLERDIVPARTLGMKTYQIHNERSWEELCT